MPNCGRRLLRWQQTDDALIQPMRGSCGRLCCNESFTTVDRISVICCNLCYFTY